MPTRRGSIQLGGRAALVEDSAMRAVDVGAAVEGRDSFGEEDDDEVPVKVLASDFDSAAMAPPPPRAPAPAREESLQVFCRLRPLARGEQGGVVDVMDPHTIRSAPPAGRARHASRHVRREARDYTFARVFDAAATQNEVYERTTAPLVDGLFGGRSALLFTYGVTNAGKSYTMMGSPEDNDTAGLLPRSLGAILARAEDQRCEVRLSFLEIYNEHVYDLMAPTGRWAKRRALEGQGRHHQDRGREPHFHKGHVGGARRSSAARNHKERRRRRASTRRRRAPTRFVAWRSGTRPARPRSSCSSI